MTARIIFKAIYNLAQQNKKSAKGGDKGDKVWF